MEETAKENADREMHVRICREGGKREKDIRQTKKKEKDIHQVRGGVVYDEVRLRYVSDFCSMHESMEAGRTHCTSCCS